MYPPILIIFFLLFTLYYLIFLVLSIFNLYVLTFLFYCDKNFLYNNLITLYNERSVPHETHPSL